MWQRRAELAAGRGAVDARRGVDPAAVVPMSSHSRAVAGQRKRFGRPGRCGVVRHLRDAAAERQRAAEEILQRIGAGEITERAAPHEPGARGRRKSNPVGSCGPPVVDVADVEVLVLVAEVVGAGWSITVVDEVLVLVIVDVVGAAVDDDELVGGLVEVVLARGDGRRRARTTTRRARRGGRRTMLLDPVVLVVGSDAAAVVLVVGCGAVVEELVGRLDRRGGGGRALTIHALCGVQNEPAAEPLALLTRVEEPRSAAAARCRGRRRRSWGDGRRRRGAQVSTTCLGRRSELDVVGCWTVVVVVGHWQFTHSCGVQNEPAAEPSHCSPGSRNAFPQLPPVVEVVRGRWGDGRRRRGGRRDAHLRSRKTRSAPFTSRA